MFVAQTYYYDCDFKLQMSLNDQEVINLLRENGFKKKNERKKEKKKNE